MSATRFRSFVEQIIDEEWRYGDDAPIAGDARAFLDEIDRLRANLKRATDTLISAGYTDHGGEHWKPPIGPPASPLLDEIDRLRARVAALEGAAPLGNGDQVRLCDSEPNTLLRGTVEAVSYGVRWDGGIGVQWYRGNELAALLPGEGA